MVLEQSSDNAITVIIPTFNRRDLLRRAIDSVRSEDRVPIEIVVFDNASSDGTSALMAQLVGEDDRITYVRRDTNIGGIGNYSRALGSIETRYFVPLADDDLLLPDFLFKAYGILEADSRLGAAIFVTEGRDEDGRVTATFPAERDAIAFGRLSPRQHMSDWLRHGHYAWMSILWRREVLDLVGPPYFHTGLPSDVDFQAKVFSTYDVHLVDEPGAVFSFHAGQASRTPDMSDMSAWARIFERLDGEMARRALFTRDEYLPLREAMWDRFRGVWNLRVDAVVDPALATRLAFVAGFRLGDWPLAVRLAERAVGSPAVRPPPSTGAVRTLPGTRSLAERRYVVGRGREFLRELILWIGEAVRERQAVDDQFAAACQWGVAAQARIAEADARAETSDTEARASAVDLAHWKSRCEAAEHRLSAIQRQPLVRWLARLGLIRTARPGGAPDVPG